MDPYYADARNGVYNVHSKVDVYYQSFYYINLYSPTSGSKERNIQTYKYGEKATK